LAQLDPALGERAMWLPRILVFAICVVMFGASAGAQSQDDKWLKDLKPIVPPVVPLPPNSQLNPGSVGGSQTPYTTAPLQSPTQSPSQQQAPGLKLSIPSR